MPTEPSSANTVPLSLLLITLYQTYFLNFRLFFKRRLKRKHGIQFVYTASICCYYFQYFVDIILQPGSYEEVGDDSIVPSTPTLFVPRRTDGFGEAVSSPHVPSGRFTFSDNNPPTTRAGKF